MRQHLNSGSGGTRDCGLQVSIASSPEEIEWFDGQWKERHYLGAGRSVGDYLRQVIEQDGQAVALLVWGPPATRSRIGISGLDGAPYSGWSGSS
ncbi:hypothetical protein [Verrucomicrobium sp. 3C]|uniref:hypothetical protein n=1 Tax=Verrucomicrobium sp. 3C TaxID=1134055 RepID=UPI001E3B48F6|nr:hypothetical protein [Verrucomicrobium sp. 3C]